MVRRPAVPVRAKRSLCLEMLENRLAPAVVNWTAGGNGDFANAAAWTDASNGSHHVPGATDDAAIPAPFAVTSAANQSVHSLTAPGLQLLGGTFTVGSAFSNAGTIRVDAGTLAVAGTYTQTAGLTTVGSGAVLQAPTIQLTGGTLGGTGTIVGNVAGGGTVSPGDGAIGTLTVNGNLSLSGPLALDLAQGGQYDLLRVTGNLNLSGPLNLTNTATPPDGTQIILVDNAGNGPPGQFAGLPHGASFSAGGQNFFISYLAGDGNDVALVALPTPPRVTEVRVNDGSAQRSEVRSLAVTFSRAVTFANNDAAAAFRLRDFTRGADVTLTPSVSTDAQGRTVVTLTFSGPETDPVSGQNGGARSLIDGRYTLTVLSGAVTATANGVALDGNGDGTGGDNYVSQRDSVAGPGPHLYRLFGDADGNGLVDLLDLDQFRATFNAGVGNPSYRAYLDADNSGTVDLLDLGLFRTRFNETVVTAAPPPQFFVNPATGNDANDGRTAATAWATWGRLVTAVQNGTVFAGDWEAADGSLADIGTLPTVAAKDAWYAAYLAGDRHVTGPSIVIDTSAAPLQVTAPLVLPAGTEIRSATAAPADLRVNVPVPAGETWARPNAAAAPHVWGTTGTTTYTLAALYEAVNGQWAQLQPVAAPDLASALPLLEANVGSFYVDPATNRLYTRALQGGDPNSDGVGRQVTPNFFGLGGGSVVDVTGGRAYRISVDGGFGYQPTTGETFGSAGIGTTEWNSISIIDSSVVSRAGKHSFSSTGNLASGFVVYRNDVATLGPGGVFIGGWTHFVDFSAYQAAGTAYSIYDGNSTTNGVANVGTPGGSDRDGAYQSFTAHNAGSAGQFAARKFVHDSFPGMTTVMGGGETAAVNSAGNLFGTVAAYSGTWASSSDTISVRLPVLGLNVTATLTNPTIAPAAAYVGQLSDLWGTVSIVGGTIDLSGANIYSGAWARTGPIALTISGTTIKAHDSPTFGLVDFWADTDVLSVTGAAVIGQPGWGLLGRYNGGPVTKSWQWARNAGMIDAATTLNGGPWAATPFAARATFAAPTGTPLASYTPEAGPPFTTVSGAATVTGGLANLTGNGGVSLAWVDAGKPTGPVSAILQVASGGGSNGGLVFNGEDANNYWVAILSGQTLTLFEHTVSGYVVRGSAAVSAANGTRHVLTADPEGDRVTVTWDGTQIISYTAAARPHRVGRFAGLLEFAGGTLLFDDFEVP